MSMFNMLESAIGGAAIRQISDRVGLSANQLEPVIAALAPKLLPRIIAQSQSGALAGPGTAQPPAPGTDAAEQHGNSVLASILGSKDASRSLAKETATSTGVGAGTIEKVLPQLASVAAAAIENGQLGGSEGGLGGLLSGLAGAFGKA